MQKFFQKDGAATDAEKMAWLRLIRTENVGPITFYKFIERFGTASKALEAIPELAARSGRKRPLVIPHLSAIEKEYATIRKMGGDIIAACDDVYPLALAATEDAPPVLTVLGNPDLMHKSCIGVVGARNASMNGRKFAEALSRDLGAQGHIIVSGLARGIDTAAHKGALQTGTIAVVAGGLDVVYPPENKVLYNEIAKHGLVIAENPPGTPPRAQDFPRRNRIVSGLSAGIVVVEATERSGSLITARLAGEQGRDVYAVPGHPLDPRASGPNKLIRDGAVLVRNAADIIESVGSYSGQGSLIDGLEDNQAARFVPSNDVLPPAEDENTLDDARETIMAALSYTPVHIDELIRETGISVGLLQTVMLEMELGGTVQRLHGNRIVLL